jgi:phosphoglycerate dehydrogenase-like enzyme
VSAEADVDDQRRRGADVTSTVVTGDALGDKVAEALAAAGHDVIRGPRPRPPEIEPVLPRERWAEAGETSAVVVVSPRDSCPRELVEAMPHLRGIVSLVIGIETIDTDAAAERDILVAHGAMEENYLGVSEAVVMLIAALLLEFRAKERWLREGMASDRLPGRMVRGNTIGLIGMGRSARGVVQRLSGWEVRVVAHDPFVDEASVPDEVEMVDLPVLLAESDIVSVHATLDAGTRHLLSDAQFAAMKPGACLINLARGAIVDEAALVRALESNTIWAAALDVFEREPLPEDSPLRRLDNVILTPHCVGHSAELMDAVPRVACENVTRILQGRLPPYPKSPPHVVEQWLERWKHVAARAGAPSSRRSG